MWLDRFGDSEEEEEDYDGTCNQLTSRSRRTKGFDSICIQGLSTERLVQRGWQRRLTSGRNSFIFTKQDRVLKVVKNQSALEFCDSFFERVSRIRGLQRRLGNLSPRIYHIKACAWNSSPALVLVMKHMGETRPRLPEVTDGQIERIVSVLVKTKVFSTDVYTDSMKVNHGNLAFRFSPKSRNLHVSFLDVDAVENYYDVSAIPESTMHDLWTSIIHVCLRRIPQPPLPSWKEYERIRRQMIPLFH